MDINDYQKLAGVTEFTPDFIRLGQGPEHDRMVAQLIHATLGFASELGEIADALKKLVIYGKALDTVNLFEEGGDMSWYLALYVTAIRRTLEDCMATNIAKLKARYGEKFTQAAALNRNLEKERAVLEGKTEP